METITDKFMGLKHEKVYYVNPLPEKIMPGYLVEIPLSLGINLAFFVEEGQTRYLELKDGTPIFQTYKEAKVFVQSKRYKAIRDKQLEIKQLKYDIELLERSGEPLSLTDDEIYEFLDDTGDV